jgi:hypothetical protein
MPVRNVKIREMFQARVSQKLKWPHHKIELHYDSQLIFPTLDLAEKFVPYYIRELAEMTLIDPKRDYDTGVLTLTVYDGVEER